MGEYLGRPTLTPRSFTFRRAKEKFLVSWGKIIQFVLPHDVRKVLTTYPLPGKPDTTDRQQAKVHARMLIRTWGSFPHKIDAPDQI